MLSKNSAKHTQRDKDKTPTLITVAQRIDVAKLKGHLLLGSWCLENEHLFESEQYQICEYPFADAQDTMEHVDKINTEYKRLLQLLSEYLTCEYGLIFGPRGWEILLGPWLRKAVEIVYERHVCLRAAVSSHEVNTIDTLPFLQGSLVTLDTADLSDLGKTDFWNLKLYSRIAELDPVLSHLIVSDQHKVVKHSYEHLPQTQRSREPQTLSTKVKYINTMLLKLGLCSFALVFKNHFLRNTRHLILASYLSKKTAFILNLWLNKTIWPVYHHSWSKTKELQSTSLDWPVRERLKQLLLSNRNQSEFSNITSQLIPELMPMVYIENIRQMYSNVDDYNSHFPENVETVLMSVEFYKDELLKFWLARKENSLKIFINQHGGEYFTGLYSGFLDTELSISDLYLACGRHQSDVNTKIKPFGVNFSSSKIRNKNSNGTILILVRPFNRYATSMNSSTSSLSTYLKKYLLDITTAVNNFSAQTSEKVVIRCHPKDKSYPDYWNLGEALQRLLPSTTFSSEHTTLSQELENSKLVICTYNGTPFLQMLSLDMPVLLLLDEQNEPIRDSAKPIFKELAKAKVLHNSAKNLAKHVNKIYPNVEQWYGTKLVTGAIKDASDQFALRRPTTFRDYLRVFQQHG